MKKLLVAMGMVLPLALVGTAAAKDMKGRFGAGGQADTGGGGGLSLKYWVSDLGFQGLFNLVNVSVDPDDDGPLDSVSTTGFNLALRVLYNIARANDTNMYAGAGVTLGLIDAEKTQIDVILGVEHFFTDYFSVAGHVGLHIDVTNDTLIAVGVPASWGTSFHFYF